MSAARTLSPHSSMSYRGTHERQRFGSSEHEQEQELVPLTPKDGGITVTRNDSDSDIDIDIDSEDEAMSFKNTVTLNMQGSSVSSSIMNLANTVMGARIMGLPYAVSQCGYLLSAIFFLFFSLLSSIALNLAMSAARTLSPHSSYDSMSKASIARINKLVDLAVSINSFGVATSYMIVVGDSAVPVVHEFTPTETLQRNEWLDDRRFWIFIFTMIFIFPVVPWKSMDALKYTSLFAIACFGYVTIIVILFAAGVMELEEKEEAVKVTAFPTDLSFMKVIPIFLFAFSQYFFSRKF